MEASGVKVGDVQTRLAFVGEMHNEKGRAIVGDVDVMEVLLKQWGGFRQNVHVLIEVRPIMTEAIIASPSASGTFAEQSEPK